MTPSTFTYGPWLPDMSNQGMPALFGPVLGTVPCADLLNVRYADGNYRCMESPVAAAPALAQQVLGAFTWYDNNSGVETVFAANANGISALKDGVWTSVPFFNAVTVSGISWGITSRWGNNAQGISWRLNSSWQAGTGSGQFLNGTLTSAQINSFEWGFGGGAGALTPATDINGHTITEMALFPTSPAFVLTISTPNLGAAYFTSITFPSLSKTLLSSAASYSTDGSTESQWTWTSGLPGGIQTPGNYAVTIQ